MRLTHEVDCGAARRAIVQSVERPPKRRAYEVMLERRHGEDVRVVGRGDEGNGAREDHLMVC